MALALTGLHAQDMSRFNRLYCDNPETDIINRVNSGMNSRDLPRRQLPVRQWLMGDTARYWCDGVKTFCSFYEPEERCVMLHSFYADTGRFGDAVSLKPADGNKLLGDNGTTVTVEQLGAYVMLVERGKAGDIRRAFYSISSDDIHDGCWTHFVRHMLDGVYAVDGIGNVVFGPKMSHYVIDRFDSDPGFYLYCIDTQQHAVDILYGEGRCSHGDPSSPKYGHMPGGGGAGALMPPMQWRVSPSAEGLKAVVTDDQPFVDHYPALAEGVNILNKTQGPYDGLQGKWTFASVMPLTPSLLAIFPADVLTLMRAEIYARHGDTFSDPATQRYFDAQPWYRKTDGKVSLTAVERFNYNLIKQVEHSAAVNP